MAKKTQKPLTVDQVFKRINVTDLHKRVIDAREALFRVTVGVEDAVYDLERYEQQADPNPPKRFYTVYQALEDMLEMMENALETFDAASDQLLPVRRAVGR